MKRQTTTLLTTLLLVLPACGEADSAGSEGEAETHASGHIDGSTSDDGSDDSATSDTGTSADTGMNTDGTTDSDTSTSTDTTDTGQDETTSTTGGGDPPDCAADDPGWGALSTGQPVKYIGGVNHDGSAFNICQFEGSDQLLDVISSWCGPCQGLSEYLSGSENGYFDGGYEQIGINLRTVIDSGALKFTTFIVEGNSSQPGVVSDAQAWEAIYPNEKIPVVTEGDVPMLADQFNQDGYPGFYHVGPDLMWVNAGGWTDALDSAIAAAMAGG